MYMSMVLTNSAFFSLIFNKNTKKIIYYFYILCYTYKVVMIMKEKSKLVTFLITMVIVLLIGLYYVIFIYGCGKNNKNIEDKEGSCNIDKCEEKVEYIKELEKFKTYDDNYLILPIISINEDNETIIKINENIENKFNYYKELYNKENNRYLSTYNYSIEPDNNILSLIIHFCGDDNLKNYECEFIIYNIDINSNKVLSNQELLKLYNVNNDIVDNDSLIYLNDSFKIVLIVETDDNFIEKVLN